MLEKVTKLKEPHTMAQGGGKPSYFVPKRVERT
jgi:hypothetical protein